MSVNTRQEARKRRHWRVRNKVRGTAERPRLSVMVSIKHMYVQLIDDEAGHTLVSVSTHALDGANNVEKATQVGIKLAELAREKGIEHVVFDRGGFKYGGRVKAIAEAVREGGLKL